MNTVKDAITLWLKKNPIVFRYRWDGDALTLNEYASGKTICVDVRKFSDFRLMPHPQGLADYLNLVFDDGRQLVLCHAGLAFSPSFTSTGPLPDAPPVSCLADYHKLLSKLKDLMSEDGRKGEILTLFNVLLSILDGAREIGLAISQEEEDLDKLLEKFEGTFTN
jgi:hypothetical protein